MPSICCVPNCKGNYRNGPKVTVFQFPQDSNLKKNWIHAIKRKDFTPSQASRVCEVHFQPHEILRESSAFDEKTGRVLSYSLKVPKLLAGAIPSVFPNCPKYLSSTSVTPRPSKDELMEKKEQSNLATALERSRAEFQQQEQKDRCQSTNDIMEKLNLLPPWHVLHDKDKITICDILYPEGSGPHIQNALVIDNALELHAFIGSVKIPEIGEFKFPLKVARISTIMQVCDTLAMFTNDTSCKSESDENARFIRNVQLILRLLQPFTSDSYSFHAIILFVYEQLQLLTKNKRVYTPEFLVFSAIFYNVSPHAFRFLCSSGKCILPCYSTIRKLTLADSMNPFHEQSDNTFLFYIKQKFKALLSSDRTVVLLIDEIHIKPFFDYKGGTVTGAAVNTMEPANSAFVFMINSLFSKYKDVVHVLPSRKMSAEMLHSLISRIVIGLKTIGFSVISVITDNNSINRKAMSFFVSPPKFSTVYPHPCDNHRPLFFVLDSVHVFKCIRNNWLNQKSQGRCMVYPFFKYGGIATSSNSGVAYASFESLKHLHHLESSCILKFSYKLSLKALEPTNLERQNVKLVLQIFNDFVSQGMLQLGEKHNILHYQDTSVFIKLITTWWSVVNVKTPHKGQRLNNEFQQPILLRDTEPKKFLTYFLDWLERWGAQDIGHGKLTPQTFSALRHTTHALLELSDYCLKELGSKYVLLGKFQTDSLEARFGQYRQLSGGNYNVSLRQVYECEKKIRLLSVLNLKVKTENISLTDFTINWDQLHSTFSPASSAGLQVTICENDFDSVEDCLPVITYIAGYCCYSVNKRLKCSECKERMVSDVADQTVFANSLIKGVSRGELLYPSSEIVRIVIISYVVMNKLTMCEEFMKSHSQRLSAVHSILDVLDNDR